METFESSKKLIRTDFGSKLTIYTTDLSDPLSKDKDDISIQKHINSIKITMI